MNINKYAKYLGLKCPYSIVLKSKRKKHTGAYWALYDDNGILKRHLIHIYLGNLKDSGERGLDTLIAHELIHAYQTENDSDEIHGPVFKRMATELEIQFNLRDVYIAALDTP